MKEDNIFEETVAKQASHIAITTGNDYGGWVGFESKDEREYLDTAVRAIIDAHRKHLDSAIRQGKIEVLEKAKEQIPLVYTRHHVQDPAVAMEIARENIDQLIQDLKGGEDE